MLFRKKLQFATLRTNFECEPCAACERGIKPRCPGATFRCTNEVGMDVAGFYHLSCALLDKDLVDLMRAAIFQQRSVNRLVAMCEECDPDGRRTFTNALKKILSGQITGMTPVVAPKSAGQALSYEGTVVSSATAQYYQTLAFLQTPRRSSLVGKVKKAARHAFNGYRSPVEVAYISMSPPTPIPKNSPITFRVPSSPSPLSRVNHRVSPRSPSPSVLAEANRRASLKTPSPPRLPPAHARSPPPVQPRRRLQNMPDSPSLEGRFVSTMLDLLRSSPVTVEEDDRMIESDDGMEYPPSPGSPTPSSHTFGCIMELAPAPVRPSSPSSSTGSSVPDSPPIGLFENRPMKFRRVGTTRLSAHGDVPSPPASPPSPSGQAFQRKRKLCA